MHLALEVRQVVFPCPFADLVLVAAGSAVAVGAVAVVLLQEFLKVALQILFEDDTPELKVLVLLSEAGFLLAVSRVEIRIVVDRVEVSRSMSRSCSGTTRKTPTTANARLSSPFSS